MQAAKNHAKVARKFELYIHNMGGICSKLVDIGNRIEANDYHFIIIQETWLNDGVSDAEVAAFSSYVVNRMDRSKFKSTKKKGGGVIILAKEGIPFEQVESRDRKILEHQIIRAKNGNKSICIVNIYAPSTVKKKKIIDEINSVLLTIRKMYPDDTWIVVGDFNFPDIHWSYDSQQNLLEPRSATMSDTSKLLVERMGSFGLIQMNQFTNRNGVALDLVFTNDQERITVREALPDELLDANSRHHNAIIVYIDQVDAIEGTNEREKVSRQILLKKSTGAMANLPIPIFVSDDIHQQGFFNTFSFTADYKILRAIEHIADVQNRFTKVTKFTQAIGESRHPWIRDKQLKKLKNIKAKAKSNHRKFNDARSIAALRMAHINVSQRFNQLRIAYFAKAMKGEKQNSMEFYELMRAKTRERSSLPHMMLANDLKVFGKNRYTQILLHLQSCFGESAVHFSSNPMECGYQLMNIYHRNAQDGTLHVELWSNYRNSVTEAQVANYLRKMDPKKTSGSYGYICYVSPIP